MRTSRLIVGTLAAGLLGLTPVAIAAPSHATETLATTTVAAASYTKVVYGDDISVNVDVNDANGQGVYDGTSTLMAMEPGATTWTAVATGTSPYSSYYDVKPRMNTTYKVVYSGYTATSTYDDNYVASESAPFTVSVVRDVNIDKAKAKLTIKGKVKPDYKNKKVKIQIKKGKRYVKFKTIKTTNKSTCQVRLPAPRRGSSKLFFKIIVPGNSQFVTYSDVWYTYTY